MESAVQKHQCIITAINEKYVPFFSVLLKSIIENTENTEKYEIVVFYSQLSEESQTILNGMICKENIWIRFFDVSRWIRGWTFFVNGENQRQYLSQEAYFRLLAHELLPEYQRALYLDSDMVVQPGWTDIFQIELESYLLAAVPDIWDNWKCNLPGSHLAEYRRKELGINNFAEYFNSGMMLLNLEKMRAIFKCRELLEVAASKSWKKHDQDVLNYMCKGKVLLLDYRWNLIECPNKAAADAISQEERRQMQNSEKEKKIIHFASRKPWKVRGVQNEDAFWKYAVGSSFFDLIFSLFIEEQLQQGKYFEQTVYKSIYSGRVGIKFIIICIKKWLDKLILKHEER